MTAQLTRSYLLPRTQGRLRFCRILRLLLVEVEHSRQGSQRRKLRSEKRARRVAAFRFVILFCFRSRRILQEGQPRNFRVALAILPDSVGC